MNWHRKNLLDTNISDSTSIPFVPTEIAKADRAEMRSFVNPYSYIRVLESEFPLEKFHYAVDGQLLSVLHSLFFRTRVRRVGFDFTSIANDVFKACEANGWRLAIIGAKPGEPEIAEQNIRKLFPALNIVYLRHGYFDSEAEIEVCISEISGAETDILICGMGTPKQEEFLLEAGEARAFKWGYTCGGFVSQTSEGTYYYPRFVMKYGFRALYRIYRHGYVRKRVMFDYPKFIFIYLVGLFKKGSNKI